jgi:hypothetical protein
MKKMWKKWVATTAGMRLALAFLYSFVSLAISLNHTCSLEYHQECTNHQHGYNNIARIRLVFDEANFSSKIHFDNTHCSACLYSLLLKSSKLSPKTTPVAIETPGRIQIVPQLTFSKQPEHLSSISLRAPPSIAS